MKIPRPYIPLSVRLAVARRQALEMSVPVDGVLRGLTGQRAKLNRLLMVTFGKPVHLDHDPPLMQRQFLYHNGKHVAYSPPANDPDHLIYRPAEDHRIKTFVRGDGAQRSDMAQRRYLKRVKANRNPKPKFKPRKPKQMRRISDAVPVIQRHGAKVE